MLPGNCIVSFVNNNNLNAWSAFLMLCKGLLFFTEIQPERGRHGEKSHKNFKEKSKNCKKKFRKKIENEKKYRKRLYRLKATATSNPDSPKEKTRAILNNHSSIRKTLNFHYALLADIKERYKATKKTKVRNMYTCLFTGKLVKKYKFRALCKQTIGFKWKPIQNKSSRVPLL